MSAPSPSTIVAPLREAVVQAAWTQWGAVGFGAAALHPARAIVDPEALVLATLAFGELERRLGRAMGMWLGVGSRLLSVGRLTNLQRDYPAALAAKVQAFAAGARAEGDARWSGLAGGTTARRRKRTGTESVTPDLRQPSTVMLRLRLAMGVGIKADALALLIGCGGAGQTIRDIATSTGYYERAVRRAVEDLAAARLVQMMATSPVKYHVRWKDWEHLLSVDESHAPLWRYWHQLYAAAAALDAWARQAEDSSWTAYVAASRLRDTFDGLAPVLARALVREVPDWSRPPERWLEEMEGWVGKTAERMRALV
jgi:hypothetical protein